MKTAQDLVDRAKDPEQRLNTYMAHELRAPLTSIRSALGYLQMQLEAVLNPEQLQALALALRNADRLDGLIDGIMDFSKLRAGKMKMNLQAAHARDMIQEAIDSMRSWALAKGIRLLKLEPAEPLPRVFADPQRTVQAIINLVSNAIKFTPVGGRVEVSAALGRYEHRGTLVFKVKDTGAGVPQADQERIFQCFEQSALGRKTSSGTGLGLTITKALVELQGGRIWVESWRGLGAAFLFTVPILPNDLPKPVEVYPKPVEYHGILVDLFRRLNAFVAAFFA